MSSINLSPVQRPEPPPIVQELFKLLPPLGQPFSDTERKRFIAAAEAIFAVVYPMPVTVLKPGERFEPFPSLREPPPDTDEVFRP